MYRQGGGWIVSTWSDHDGLNVLSEELPFFVARQGLADWRREHPDGVGAASVVLQKAVPFPLEIF